MLSMPIEMVGKIAGGLSLFALGLLFYGERPTVNIQTCTNISIKNLIQPAMMAPWPDWPLGSVIPLMQQVIIIGATPSAIAAGCLRCAAIPILSRPHPLFCWVPPSASSPKAS